MRKTTAIVSHRYNKTKAHNNTPKKNSSTQKTHNPVLPIQPSASTPLQILQLQKTIGNRAVQRMIESGAIVPRRSAFEPGDIYTREVDRLTQRVTGNQSHTRMPDNTSGHVTQLYLNRELTTNGDLQELIDQYNKQYKTYTLNAKKLFSNTETDRRAALKTLHKIEKSIYQYFDTQHLSDLDVEPANINMKVLMNEVQKERIDLVSLSIKKKDKIPPVANFDELFPEEQGKITTIWQNLLKGRGIKITGDSDFRNKVMADFSRLMENQFGRDMVHRIATTRDALVITPTTMKEGKFAASPMETEKEGFQKLSEPPPDKENYTIIPSSSSHDYKLSVFRKIRMELPQSKGIALKFENRIEYYKFNVGTGSTMTFPQDSIDADRIASSRLLGSGGREIIAPTFITLGHELGHVLRSLMGISASKSGQEFIESAFENPENIFRPEEFFNIQDMENRLREENLMSKREGHSNVYMQVASEMFTTMESWSQYVDTFKLKEKSDLSQIALLLEKFILDIQLDLQKILQNKGGDLRPINDKFGKAVLYAQKLREALKVVVSLQREKKIETVTGKHYDGSEFDLYRAIEEIAEDRGADDYADDLQQVFRSNYPFDSQEAMSRAFQEVLPPKKSSAANRIAEYLVENSS